MKKTILSSFAILAFCVSTFASNGEVKVEKEVPKKVEKSQTATITSKEVKPTLCRVKCCESVSDGNSTFTTCVSAGSIFTNCDTAMDRCQNKLDQAMSDED